MARLIAVSQREKNGRNHEKWDLYAEDPIKYNGIKEHRKFSSLKSRIRNLGFEYMEACKQSDGSSPSLHS